MLQELYSSGAIKSGTDFQVYREVAGLSGLDFAYVDNSAVYHTKVFPFVFFFPSRISGCLPFLHSLPFMGKYPASRRFDSIVEWPMYYEAQFFAAALYSLVEDVFSSSKLDLMSSEKKKVKLGSNMTLAI